jgi:hypothetical protein
MKTTYPIAFFFGLFLASLVIPLASGAQADYVGICPGASMVYSVTKDHYVNKYTDQQWTINITGVDEGEDLVGSKPGMYISTEVTGQNVSDLYYNDHFFIYENLAEEDNQSLCTGEIEWVINKGLAGNHSYGNTNLYFDANGVLQEGIIVQVEGSWLATYIIIRTRLDLGNCLGIPGYELEILTLCGVVATSVLLLRGRGLKKHC